MSVVLVWKLFCYVVYKPYQFKIRFTLLISSYAFLCNIFRITTISGCSLDTTKYNFSFPDWENPAHIECNTLNPCLPYSLFYVSFFLIHCVAISLMHPCYLQIVWTRWLGVGKISYRSIIASSLEVYGYV